MTTFSLDPEEQRAGSPALLSALLEDNPSLAQWVMQIDGGMEDYKSATLPTRRLSLGNEDLKETVSDLLAKFIRLMENIIQDLFNGTLAATLVYEKILNRAEDALVDARTNARKTHGNTMRMDTRIQNLCVNYRPVTDVASLVSHQRNLQQVAKLFFEYQNGSALSPLANIRSTPVTPEGFTQLLNAISYASPMQLVQGNVFNTNGYSHQTVHLLGNHKLVIMNRYPEGDAKQQLTHIEFRLQTSDPEPRELPEFIDFQRFAKPTEFSLIKQVIQFAEMVVANNTVSLRFRRQNRLQAMLTFVKEIKHGLDTGQLDENAVALRQGFIDLLGAYKNWLTDPYLNFMAYCSRDLNAILNVCEANSR